jgi:excisionase family DNA binding protein
MSETAPVWLSAEQAATYVGTSKATILRAARSGRLLGFRIAGGRLWRFRPVDLDQWVMRMTSPRLAS